MARNAYEKNVFSLKETMLIWKTHSHNQKTRVTQSNNLESVLINELVYMIIHIPRTSRSEFDTNGRMRLVHFETLKPGCSLKNHVVQVRLLLGTSIFCMQSPTLLLQNSVACYFCECLQTVQNMTEKCNFRCYRLLHQQPGMHNQGTPLKGQLLR